MRSKKQTKKPKTPKQDPTKLLRDGIASARAQLLAMEKELNKVEASRLRKTQTKKPNLLKQALALFGWK